MSLLNKLVTSGKVKKPFLILVYGPEKVGKSTFGSELPKPLFLCSESGTDQLDIRRAKISNWLELKTVLRELRDGDDESKTIVLDTVDWFEQLLLKFLIAESHVDSAKDLGGGWGAYKGILIAEWHNLFSLIDEVREKKNICFLAHSQCKKFSDPILSCDYDRYELKMEYPEISGVFKEYVDGIFFINFETTVKREKQTKKVRAYGDDTRILYTKRTHAFDAGNRYGMPEEIECSAKEFLKYANQDDGERCEELNKVITDLLKDFKNEEFINTVSSYVEKVKKNPIKLRATITKLEKRITEGEN